MSTSSNRRSVPIPAHTQAAMEIYEGAQFGRRLAGGYKAADLIPLGSGDPAFITPAHIREAAKAAIDAGKTHYERGATLRAAIAWRMGLDNGIGVQPEGGVCITVGAHMALYLLFRAYIAPGDEVIMADPGSYFHPNTVANGGVPVTIPLRRERGYRLDPAEVAARITPRTKLICICSPEAPAGSVLTRRDLEEIADLAIKHDLIVISDELYQEIHYLDQRPPSIGAIPGMEERTLTVNGVSKSWAMTGWRIGWVAGDPDLMRPVLAVHHLNSIAAASISQHAATAALTGPQELLAEHRTEYRRRRDRLAAALRRIPGLEFMEPEGTYYFWVDIRSYGLSSVRLSRWCLQEYGLQIGAGTAFGSEGEGFVRLSCSIPDEVADRGLERLDSALSRLRRERGAGL